MPESFKTSASERLDSYLSEIPGSATIERLTPDASTREFFRVVFDDSTSIACVYPERIDQSLPQLDVTHLFRECGLPVAAIIETDFDRGIVLHEDFGDRILRDVLSEAEPMVREALLEEAISLIAEIQKSTPKAFELNSIASQLRFDEEKLLWELNFFKKHFFESFKNEPLSTETDSALQFEFVELCRELEEFAKVLTHRDFHAANLMVDNESSLRIIDHQDARIGSIAYDLVSLLLDRIIELPSREWLANKIKYFLAQREKLGLEPIELRDFEYEFDLVAIQRCLKAIGTFSNQAGNFEKTDYVPYINPMFLAVLKTCERLGRFPVLQETVRRVSRAQA